MKEKFKHFILDTLIAIGGWGNDTVKNSRVELFTLSSLKWENKKDYPYNNNADYGYEKSILAVESKFIVFAGWTHPSGRTVLTNKDVKNYENTCSKQSFIMMIFVNTKL